MIWKREREEEEIDEEGVWVNLLELRGVIYKVLIMLDLFIV